MNFILKDDTLKNLLSQYHFQSDYSGSDFSYYAYLTWFDMVEYSVLDDFLYIRVFSNGEIRYWPPLIKLGSSKSSVDGVAMLPTDCAFAFSTKAFVDDMNNLYPDRYLVYSNRDWSEYIYNAQDFINLVGKKYSAKRNHISRFMKNYQFQIMPFSVDDFVDFEKFTQKWLQSHTFDGEDKSNIIIENNIVKSWLNSSIEGKLICDVLRIDGEIAGISVGEIFPNGTSVCMYEKADIKYEGIYSYLANQFAKRNFSECTTISRQEDMGIEGLRKSKLSYNPSSIIDKYLLTPLKRKNIDKNGKKIRPCVFINSLDIMTADIDLEENTNVLDLKCQNFDDSLLDIKLLDDTDYNQVLTFFKSNISQLENKNYYRYFTDDILLNVLAKGYMLGVFIDNSLIATYGVCTSKNSKHKIEDFIDDGNKRDFYDYFAVVVCSQLRKIGFSSKLIKECSVWASSTLDNATLFASIQGENKNTIPAFKKSIFENKIANDSTENDCLQCINNVS